MDNASRCPQSHTLLICLGEGFALLKDVEDRAERQRRNWIEAYRGLGDAGAVCRRFGVSRPTLRKWLRRLEQEGEAGLRARSRRPRHSPALKIDETLETIIIGIRRERRLGVKRIRNELRRLHTVRLSVATIHKVLVRHGLNNLLTRKRARHKPKRYERPVPGDRVQMDTCKIRPGVYQFTAIDDCSRYLVAGLSRRRSAAATLTFLDQVLEEMPFSVQRIQTDRGTEFFAEEVQRRLIDETIRFRPIPPRSPHLNGKVERAQRTCLEEFWGATDPKAADIGDQLALWVHHYNWHRSHESLHGDTPIDRVCQLADKTPLWAAVGDAYDASKERIKIRHHAVDVALQALKPSL
jgi:transposase InsO family protein